MASSPGRAPVVARTPPPEHITRLFPKCRPRHTDHNLNPLHTNRSINDNLIMDHNTTEPSDRIIEIAGGREVFCQSRSRAGRKGRQMHRAGRRDRADITLESIYAAEPNSNRRHNSRDSNSSPPPVVFPVQHSPPPPAPPHPRGSPCSPLPPVESPPPLSPPQRSKGSPMAVTAAGGEVVVFDDIGDNWQGRGLHLDFDNSDNELDNGIQRTITVETLPQQFPNTERSSPLDEESERSSGDEGGEEDDVEGDSNCSSTGAGHRVARVIGNMPISEYQESPRRYGPPRPGFPQRILANNSPSPPVGHQPQQCIAPSSTTFDYLYEFSETRKVLEEFFKCPKPNDIDHDTGTLDDINDFRDLEYQLRRHQRNQEVEDERRIINDGDLLDGLGLIDGDGEGLDEERGSGAGSWYVGQRLARPPPHHSPHTRHNHTNFLGLQQECETYEPEMNLVELSVGTGSSGSESRRGMNMETRNNIITNNGMPMSMSNSGGGITSNNITNLNATNTSSHSRTPTQNNHITNHNHHHHHKHRFTLSPETTDCESNCGDVDSDISLMMAENETTVVPQTVSVVNRPIQVPCMPILEDGLSSGHASDVDNNNPHPPTPPPLPLVSNTTQITKPQLIVENGLKNDVGTLSDADLNSLDPLGRWSSAPPPPAPEAHRSPGAPVGPPSPAPPPSTTPTITNNSTTTNNGTTVIMPPSATESQEPPPPPAAAALRDIRLALRRARALPPPAPRPPEPQPPVLWLPRRDPSRESIESVERKPTSGDEDEADTDLETDRLLGQQRTDDQGFYDDKGWRKGGGESPLSEPPAPPPPPPPPPTTEVPTIDDTKHKKDKEGKKKGKNKEGLHDPSVLIEGVLFRARYLGSTQLVCKGQPTKATRMLQAEEAVSRIKEANVEPSNNTQPQQQVYASEGVYTTTVGGEHSPTGTVFRLSFLGSVEVDEEGTGRRRRKRLKKNMVEEAVTKIKAPEGESQPSTEVDLFISTEKIMVLNTDLKEIMMDHALRTISYIADIGDLVVLMARRRFVPHEMEDPPKMNRTPKMICHVFESEEAQFIAQSIGQAFQVAYMEFLKANGIEDHSFVKEMDYQEVLNSQEIFGDELQMFAKKEMQKEVVVPKAKGEILGVVIVESGWGSMLPTVVIANLAPAGAAARCGQLNIGDQIIAINGVSLVGLPLSTCQTYIKNSKNQTVVKLTVVPCAPVVEVKIKRPDTKYQLGFSVQNGVICSLLRGGIAERGGVRVGHRIIEINNQSVVAVPHERIVNLLATSVGEILMKTMPTSMFRLLTGQENPVYI